VSRAPKEAQVEDVAVAVGEEEVEDEVVVEVEVELGREDSVDVLTGSSAPGSEHAPHKISRDPSFLTMTASWRDEPL